MALTRPFSWPWSPSRGRGERMQGTLGTSNPQSCRVRPPQTPHWGPPASTFRVSSLSVPLPSHAH